VSSLYVCVGGVNEGVRICVEVGVWVCTCVFRNVSEGVWVCVYVLKGVGEGRWDCLYVCLWGRDG